MVISMPRGTQDILPEESRKWQYIEEKLRKISSDFCYEEIRTPMFESTELFSRGVGDTTDIVQKEMYTFKDKGDRSITLRPENTASMVRCYLENSIYAKEDVSRFYYNGSMFRYERPQAGRQREFNQIGVEVFGEKSPILDAEVIAMGYNFLTKLGITDLEVKINSVGSKGSRTIYREKLVEHFQSHLDDMCEDCKDRINRNPLRLLDCKVDGDKDFYKSAPSIIDYLFEDERKHYEEVKKYLTIFGVKFTEDPTLVRGLDYYSSTVFEIVTNKLGSQGTVLGGGRYDNLLKELGDKDIPAFGFAAGVERVMMLIGDNYPKDVPDVYIAWLGDDTIETAMKIADSLRKENVKVYVDYSSKGMKSHMKKADKLETKYCIILGEDELNKGIVLLKDFSTREQKEVKIEEIINHIK